MKLNTGHSSSSIHQWMDQTKKQPKVRKYTKEQKQQFLKELKSSSLGKQLSNDLWKFLIAQGYQSIGGYFIEKNAIILKDEAILSSINKLQVCVLKGDVIKNNWIFYYKRMVSNELMTILRKTVPLAPIGTYHLEQGESFPNLLDCNHESLTHLLKLKKSFDNQRFLKNDVLYLLEIFEKGMGIKNWKRLSAANRYAAKSRILREATNTQEIFSIKDIPSPLPIIIDENTITDDSIMVSDNVIPDYIEEKSALPDYLLKLYKIGIFCRKEVDNTKKEIVYQTNDEKKEQQKLKLYINALLGIFCFDKVLQYNPKLFISRYNLSMLKRRLRMTDEAISELGSALQYLEEDAHQPNFKLYKTFALEFIGEVHMIEKSDPKTALTYYDETNSIIPFCSDTLFNRAICRYLKNKKITRLVIADLKQVNKNEKGKENPEEFYNSQVVNRFKRETLESIINDSEKVRALIPQKTIELINLLNQ